MFFIALLAIYGKATKKCNVTQHKSYAAKFEQTRGSDATNTAKPKYFPI